MTGPRRRVERVVESLIWAVNWVSSALASDSDVEAQVDDPAGNDNADAEAAEVWTIAGVQSRPKDGSEADGYAKALRVQLGDSVLVIGTHDPRHVEACQAGELLIHALGKDGTDRALIRLQPDGTIDIEGDKVRVASPSAATVRPMANGDAMAIAWDAFLNATAPTAPTIDNGLALQIAVAAALASAGYNVGVPPAACTVSKLKSTKHDVEID